MPQSGALPLIYLIPMGIALVVIVARNSRPRKLRIERLWITPAVYILLMGAALAAPPVPPVTVVNVGVLILGFAIGVALGWQRGRLTSIHIHPETHDLSSRASPIGILLIFGILMLKSVLRSMGKDIVVGSVHIEAAGDALLVMGVATIATQRLELWLRASRMLAEARAAKPSA